MSDPASRRRCGPMAWMALSVSMPAAAQTLAPVGTIDQIASTAPRAAEAAIGQVGRPGRSVAPGGVGPADAARRGAPPAQLAAPGDAGVPAQLTPAARTMQGPTQLAPAGRDARPPAPLSTPAQGRTGATVRVTGRDRCDPAAPPAAAHLRCATVIETRGDDFPPPDAEPLSPEQRTLVERRTPDQRAAERQQVAGDAIARSAARRVGRDGADAAAPAMQGIASIVLPPPAASTRADPAAGLTSEQAAAATSTLGAIGVFQP